MLKPGETPETMLTDEKIRDLLAPWKCFDRMVIERRAVYRFHGLVAEKWRDRRVLIAGDAAHQMPPFAGQGMCSGIRDAVNLAWKLAKVVRGEARDSVLDTYQQEREPHVRAIIETAIAMGKVICMLDPIAAAARDAEMLARKRSGVQDVSVRYPDLAEGLFHPSKAAGSLFPQPASSAGLLDPVLGTRPVLVERSTTHVASEGLRRLPLDGDQLAAFAEPLSAWLDSMNAEAVLVRPDRHVFGTGTADELVEAWGLRVAP